MVARNLALTGPRAMKVLAEMRAIEAMAAMVKKTKVFKLSKRGTKQLIEILLGECTPIYSLLYTINCRSRLLKAKYALGFTVH